MQIIDDSILEGTNDGTGYTSQSYASNFSPEKSIYQDDSRIFHRWGYSYDSVETITSISIGENRIVALVKLSSGADCKIILSVYDQGIIRLQMGPGESQFDLSSEMLVRIPDKKVQSTITSDENGNKILINGYVITISHYPFMLKIDDKNGKAVFSLDNEKIAGTYITSPLGFRKNREISEPFLSFRIKNDEHFFGLGEKWNKVEKSSTRATIWSSDTCGSNTTDMSYKSIPLLFSTAGWGLMLHSSYRSKWEIGTFSYTGGSTLTEDPKLDTFIFLSPTLEGLLERYTYLTGRASMPPKWALGLWMSRCMYEKREESDEVVDRLRQEEIPCDVIHLDPKWMKVHWYHKIGVDACDFDRNDEDFPNLPSMFKKYMEKGFSTDLWINPYIPEGTKTYKDAFDNGYLLKTIEGGIARLEHGNPVGMIDFTNPKARKWWKDFLLVLAKEGAASFKPDYGDRVPENALFYNGKTGKEMHNMYLHLFAETAFEAIREVYGKGITFRRAGYIGTQRFPGTWSGDTQVSWEGLRGCLRGGLSAGLSGEAFWTSDMGGFCGPSPSEELYCRWSQLGLLSGISRYHGTTPREPWYFGDTAMAVVKHYSKLRYSLMPYILSSAHESCTTGLPMMRHMALGFPSEPNVETIDDQYMLGNELLIAPVIIEGARKRFVFLPEGTWYQFDNPEVSLVGGRFVTAEAPLERVPVFIRQGAIIPRYNESLQHLKGPAPLVIVVEIYPGDSKRIIHIDEESRKNTIEYCNVDGNVAIKVEKNNVELQFVFKGHEPRSVFINGSKIPLQMSDNNFAFTF